MTTAVAAFLSATALGAILTRFVRQVGVRVGAVDYALVSRKVHRAPTPRLGGIAIVAGFFLPLIGLVLLDDGLRQQLSSSGRQALGLVVGGLVIAALGLYDDINGAGASKKFTVQIAAAALMYWCGFRIDQVTTPFGPPVSLGVFGMPFTILWIVGVTNAMNLIDGLDGLAAGVALTATFTMLVVAGVRGDGIMVLTAGTLAGATLGFLFFNFNPASIFMGDTGSTFLGFVLATIAIRTNATGSGAVALVVPIVALGLPIGDTLLAMARRAARGVPMFRGDAAHIHHRLLHRGLSHRATVLVLYGASVVFAASALVLSFANSWRALGLLLVLAGASYAILRRLGFMHWDRARQIMKERRRNLIVRDAVRRAGEAVRQARKPEQIWEQVNSVAMALNATCVGFGMGPAGAEVVKYSRGFDDAPLDMLRVRYGLTPERPGANYIELGWSGRKSVDRDSEIAIELLCDRIAPAVARIEDAVLDSREARKVVRLRA